jgi:hypothetical protein
MGMMMLALRPTPILEGIYTAYISAFYPPFTMVLFPKESQAFGLDSCGCVFCEVRTEIVCVV